MKNSSILLLTRHPFKSGFRQEIVRLHAFKPHEHHFPDLIDQFYNAGRCEHLRRVHHHGAIYWWHSWPDDHPDAVLRNLPI